LPHCLKTLKRRPYVRQHEFSVRPVEQPHHAIENAVHWRQSDALAESKTGQKIAWPETSKRHSKNCRYNQNAESARRLRQVRSGKTPSCANHGTSRLWQGLIVSDCSKIRY